MIKLKRFLIYISTPKNIFSTLDHILLLNIISFLIGWGLGIKEDLTQGLIYGLAGIIISSSCWLMILINAWKSFKRSYSYDT